MKNKFLFIFIFFILLANACSKSQQTQNPNLQKNIPGITAEDVSALAPEQVVILYYQAWNEKKYDVMYSLISNGFKQIEPTAKTFEDFKVYMSSFFETESGINIVDINQAYQSENEAGVNYKIEIIRKDGT